MYQKIISITFLILALLNQHILLAQLPRKVPTEIKQQRMKIDNVFKKRLEGLCLLQLKKQNIEKNINRQANRNMFEIKGKELRKNLAQATNANIDVILLNITQCLTETTKEDELEMEKEPEESVNKLPLIKTFSRTTGAALLLWVAYDEWQKGKIDYQTYLQLRAKLSDETVSNIAAIVVALKDVVLNHLDKKELFTLVKVVTAGTLIFYIPGLLD